MLKIAVCDDQSDFLRLSEKMIERYAQEKEVELSVSTFTTAYALLEKLEQEFQVFLLDIQMPLMDGMAIAQIIRKRDPYAYIVFITSTDKYVFDGYKIGVSNYIKKPLHYQLLKEELNHAVQYFERHRDKYLLVENKTGIHKIYLSSISYMESYNRGALIHADGEEIVCRKKMQDVEHELEGQPFFRCHSGFIVNMDYIKTIKSLTVTLVTGDEVPVSKQRRKEFVQRCAKYLGGGSI